MISQPYRVIAGEHTYTVVDDRTGFNQLLVAGRALSASFNAPPAEFAVEVDHPGVQVRILQNGFFCLAGLAVLLFPDLYGSPGTSYALNVTVRAPLHQPVARNIPVSAGSLFPLAQINVALPYLPVRIAGQAVLTADGSPVPGAVIAAAGMLRLARTPLHFDHPAGTAVNAVTISPNGGPRTLTAAAPKGATELTLNSAAALGPGSLLRLGPAERYELLVVDGPGGAPDVVRTRGATQRSYPLGAIVQPVNPASAGPSSALADPVSAGTALLPLTSALSAAAVELGSPPNRDYLIISALADASGFYGLDGVAGVSTIALRATNPAGPEFADAVHHISPKQTVNVVNFSLR